ncbi:MAG: class I SAM-dependent methyltransferase, partial [Pseudomonadota bacterium]
TEARKQRYPRYYLQNFHYQTDGWLSRDSARLYDTQVETLFSGAADAMRRQGLVPIHDFMQARDPRETRLLDIACGTGRFLSFLKQAYPAMEATGLDLSPDYLEEARQLTDGRRGLDFVNANAEATPFEDASLDIVVSVFLFHELPPKVRRGVAAEIGRILKRGGLFVLVDSIQFGDRPGFDILIENFPAEFHEPYYLGYAREDLDALFGDAALTRVSLDMAFLSRVAAYRKATRN